MAGLLWIGISLIADHAGGVGEMIVFGVCVALPTGALLVFPIRRRLAWLAAGIAVAALVAIATVVVVAS